jgi:hypothetical protein
MISLARLFSLLVSCLALSTPALAQQTWIYKSGTLNGISTFYDLAAPIVSDPDAENVTVTMTLAQPLAANLVDSLIEVQSFNVACSGECPFFGSNPSVASGGSGNGSAYFVVSTNRIGQIIDWTFVFNGNYQISGESTGNYTFTSATVDILTSQRTVNNHIINTQDGAPRGAWRSPSIVPSVKVLECPGKNVYKVVDPANNIVSAVSPNPSGEPVYCVAPSAKPPSWYIKTSADNGDTWQWTYTLEDLALGN